MGTALHVTAPLLPMRAAQSYDKDNSGTLCRKELLQVRMLVGRTLPTCGARQHMWATP